MNKWKKYIPDGMKDILFEDCRKKLLAEEILRNIYRVNGFSEIISPTLEFYDVFDFANQPISQESMYKLFDNNGRILVLKPDMTTPIARIVSTKLKNKIYPLKLCYTSNVFRMNESLNGKLSEFTQSGIEIVGSSDIRSDCEVIITAIKALKGLGINDFKIDIGQSGFFKALLEDINLEEKDIEKLKVFIENKNFIALRHFLNEKESFFKAEDIEIISKLPQLFGDISVFHKAKAITKNDKAIRALNNIYDIYNMMKNIGMDEYISIDLGMIQDMDYYTGIIFRAYVDDMGEYILSGGRYDNLIEKFGENIPATGFAINIDKVIEIIKKKGIDSLNKSKKVAVCYEDKFLEQAYKLMDVIQSKDIICELSLYEDEKTSLNYGKDNKVDTIIKVVDCENIKICNIHTGEYTLVSLNKFISMVNNSSQFF